MCSNLKDCAVAVHVIQEDRRVLSVKFDDESGGLVRRGCEAGSVYGAVEDYIDNHRDTFQYQIPEVGARSISYEGLRETRIRNLSNLLDTVMKGQLSPN